ncbi:MAG: septum site-determining protein MinD [Cyanobacteria bacterium RYN_339]|nr:septum site-determining protein MinD [Cyanobacteria bacterium RYN_339]
MEATAIVITSGKGGVGKTTITANLGMGLAGLGYKVCLVDTDTGLRNLDLVLGLEQRIVFDLVDVARGHCRLQQALIHDRRNPNLYVLPTSQRCDKTALKPADMRLVMAALRQSFDYVLIDCPAGIEEGFQVAIAAADQALVIVNPEVSSVRDADRVLGMLQEAGMRDVRLIINRLRPEMVARNDMMDVRDIEEILGVPMLAALQEDSQVIVSTNRGEPLVLDKRAKTGKLFEEMAKAVSGRQICLVAMPGPITFMGRIKALFA